MAKLYITRIFLQVQNKNTSRVDYRKKIDLNDRSQRQNYFLFACGSKAYLVPNCQKYLMQWKTKMFYLALHKSYLKSHPRK